MFLSVFELFKIGLGPSSSHTMGPMIAGGRFLAALASHPVAPHRVRASLHGSLALTGVGHASDRATILGLAGFEPETYDRDKANAALARIDETGVIEPPSLAPFAFAPRHDLRFDFASPLPGHANGMILSAFDHHDEILFTQTYYSIGGGFVQTEAELMGEALPVPSAQVPHPFASAGEMLAMARASGKSIAQLKRENERVFRDEATLTEGVFRLWQVMNRCIDRGLTNEGVLPGGLDVPRRAPRLHRALLAERGSNLAVPHTANEWMAAYAMAVNEENAAGGQVVTAPTNGAAGVVPAVMRYWLDHMPGATLDKLDDYLLTAAAIGGLIKHNASISGAECGCQAEVGSASAMAAAGLAAVLGASPPQIENAAEIALEHHLGLTCDPIMGLVQVPCIERNGLAAIKAVSAASLALRGDGEHLVSLDACIRTMRQTGRDMNEKYKETSRGGLAVNVPEC